MIKQTTVKEDRRKLVYYWFAKRPLGKAQSAKPNVERGKSKG